MRKGLLLMIRHPGGTGPKVPLRKPYSRLRCEIGEIDILHLHGHNENGSEVSAIVEGPGEYLVNLSRYTYVHAALDNKSGVLGTVTLEE